MKLFKKNQKHILVGFLSYKFDFTSTNRRFSLVFFTTITTFLFLNFFEPFGLYYDKTIPRQEVFVELFVAMAFAFVILVITQFVLRPLFKILKPTILNIFGWFLLETVLVAITWTFLDAFIVPNDASMTKLFVENLIAYPMIMLVPYFIFIWFVYFKDRLRIIEEREIKSESSKQTVPINDELGETKLFIDIKNLLFIQSADNYVEVNYLENNSIKKNLVRNSIKNLETDLQNFPIIRCHRSYMLNTKNIESARKTSAGFEVKMQQDSDTTIPVSRSYVSELKKYVSSFN